MPDHFLPTVAAHFWSQVLLQGERTAFYERRSRGLAFDAWNWRQIGELVHRGAQWLGAHGLVAGDHVATYLANSLDWVAIDLACQTIGIVHVAIDTREPAIKVDELAVLSDAKLVIREPLQLSAQGSQGIEASVAALLFELSRGVDPNLVAQILLTSGTSQHPKLVALSNRNLLSNALAKLDAAPQFASDLRLNFLPFSHAYARTCELSTWIVTGGQLAIADGWDDFLEAADRLQPTLVNLVPFLAGQIAAARTSSTHVLGARMRLLQVGGAPLHEELWNQLSELGLPPLQGYGLTEASPVVCSNRAGRQRSGVIGPAVQGVQLRIDDAGVLWTRGEHVMLGYWGDPGATQAAIRDGWLCTGDLVEATQHGLRVVGRVSQQITLTTGYKVCPEAIELRLQRHPWISQAVVLGHGQPHIRALVWPNLHAIAADYFEPRMDLRNAAASIASLRSIAWLEQLAEQIHEDLRDLPHYARPRVIELLPAPLSQAAGSLTRKGTPNRWKLSQSVRTSD